MVQKIAHLFKRVCKVFLAPVKSAIRPKEAGDTGGNQARAVAPVGVVGTEKKPQRWIGRDSDELRPET